MTENIDEKWEKALENSKELKYAGKLVEIPVAGRIDKDGIVHFFDEPQGTILVPADAIKEARSKFSEK